MAVDYGAKEKEFIAGLEEDTGRDLAGWMEAIDEAGLGHRNDIIDWLRQQGFLFSKASWLERIHHNGGRPIYGDGAAARLGGATRRLPPAAVSHAPDEPPPSPAAHRVAADDARPPVVAVPTAPRATPMSEDQSPPPATTTVAAFSALPRPAVPPLPLDPELATLLATAKAYRPLAQLLLAEAAKACSGLSASVRDDYVVLAAPAEFATVVVSPKDIRLGLDLGGWPFAPPLQRAKLTGPPARFGHMVVLTDARQIDAHLLGFVRAARDRANRG